MPSTRVSRTDWRELFVANLETAFFMSQAISRELRRLRLKGSIISLSSISGMNTAPFHIAYGTAKAAVVAMTRTMAVELALDNIRVNAVSPGWIETDMTKDLPEAAKKAMAEGAALARAGTAREVAEAIAFLASDRAAFITGEVLRVNGGLYM